MTLKEEFLDYLEFHAGRSVYVWGGQGEDISALTDEKIREMETSPANAARVIAFKRKRQGIKGAKAFDCSGLGMYFFDNIKGLYSDMTADDMMNISKKISKEEITSGDMVFKVYSGGKAYHMGYVSKDMQVIEAKGRDDGVVKRPIAKGKWQVFARFPVFLNEDIKDFRNLKLASPMMRGDDVKKLQQALINKGFDTGKSGADGIFGADTKKAVTAFQKANGLTADGIFGKNTLNALYTQKEQRLLKYQSPTLKGEDVKKVQEALIKKGFAVGNSGIDGSFGPATKNAVIAFQKANGLAPDGIVGSKTRSALF